MSAAKHTPTPNYQAEQRERFIKAVACFVAENQVAKGISLQIRKDDITGFGKDWCAVRDSLPGFSGYPSVANAESEIKRIFNSDDADKATIKALADALTDAISGLVISHTALKTAESCMGTHEMQDSKWDNARHLIYTSKIAAHATKARAEAALAQAKGQS